MDIGRKEDRWWQTLKERWRKRPEGGSYIHPALTMTSYWQRDRCGEGKEATETRLLSWGQKSMEKPVHPLFMNMGPPTVNTPSLPVCAALPMLHQQKQCTRTGKVPLFKLSTLSLKLTQTQSLIKNHQQHDSKPTFCPTLHMLHIGA